MSERWEFFHSCRNESGDGDTALQEIRYVLEDADLDGIVHAFVTWMEASGGWSPERILQAVREEVEGAD